MLKHLSSRRRGRLCALHPATVFALRLAGLLLTWCVVIVLVKTDGFADAVGRPLGGRLHFGALPVELVTGLLIGTALTARQMGARRMVIAPNRKEVARGSLLLIATLWAAASVTHPAAGMQWLLDVVQLKAETAGSAMVGAIRYSAVALTLGPIAMLWISARVLRLFRSTFLWGWFSVYIYLWLEVARIASHERIGPPLVQVIAAILNVVPGIGTPSVEGLEMQLGNFWVWIGPPCLGLDSATLFLVCYCFLCISLLRHRAFSFFRAGVALVAGLVILAVFNLVRITGIMIIGAHAPQLAVDLFHALLGPALFFAVLAVYGLWIVPRWVMRTLRRG